MNETKNLVTIGVNVEIDYKSLGLLCLGIAVAVFVGVFAGKKLG